MKKRTKSLQFSEKVAEKIIIRDKGCLFCRKRYHMCSVDRFAYQIHDIMHIVAKSQGGLGIEQNGVLGCRYHHSLLDNGNKGLRDEMISIISDYMVGQYPDWNPRNLVYKKYGIDSILN